MVVVTRKKISSIKAISANDDWLISGTFLFFLAIEFWFNCQTANCLPDYLNNLLMDEYTMASIAPARVKYII